MIGMHGAMLCGFIEVENEVEVHTEVEIKTEIEMQNKRNDYLSEGLLNSNSLSKNVPENCVTLQRIENERMEIEKFTYVSKLSPTPSPLPSIVPPVAPAYSFPSPLGTDVNPNKPSAIFQLAVEASIVMISGIYHLSKYFHFYLYFYIHFYFHFLFFTYVLQLLLLLLLLSLSLLLLLLSLSLLLLLLLLLLFSSFINLFALIIIF